jgi:hypothetical protein
MGIPTSTRTHELYSNPDFAQSTHTKEPRPSPEPPDQIQVSLLNDASEEAHPRFACARYCCRRLRWTSVSPCSIKGTGIHALLSCPSFFEISTLDLFRCCCWIVPSPLSCLEEADIKLIYYKEQSNCLNAATQILIVFFLSEFSNSNKVHNMLPGTAIK